MSETTQHAAQSNKSRNFWMTDIFLMLGFTVGIIAIAIYLPSSPNQQTTNLGYGLMVGFALAFAVFTVFFSEDYSNYKSMTSKAKNG